MCCSDSSPPPAPDYSGLAAANEASARYAKEAADADLAFRKEVYNDSKAGTAQMRGLATQVANSQLQDAATARARSDLAWDDWKTYGRPLQQTVINEANAYGGTADQARQAGRAIADVNSQAANARAQNARAMAAMGVNPNSGRFAAMSNAQSLGQAAMAAGAATNARTQARDKGMALRAGALAGLTGQQNVAGQNMGLGINAGTAATSNMGAGANAGLGWANFGAGGTGNAINAANIGVQGNLGLAGVMSGDYRTASANYQADSQSGLGQLAGMAIGGYMGGAGGKALNSWLSDRRAKEHIEYVGVDSDTGLNLYDFNYIGEDRRYRGVMADEVINYMPDAVIEGSDGLLRVNYDMLGIQMVEV